MASAGNRTPDRPETEIRILGADVWQKLGLLCGRSRHRKLRRLLRGFFVCKKLASYKIMVQPKNGTGR
jgi:hypothetical protein